MSVWMKLKRILHLNFEEQAAREVELRNRARGRRASARFSRGNVARQQEAEDCHADFEEMRSRLRGLKFAK